MVVTSSTLRPQQTVELESESDVALSLSSGASRHQLSHTVSQSWDCCAAPRWQHRRTCVCSPPPFMAAADLWSRTSGPGPLVQDLWAHSRVQ